MSDVPRLKDLREGSIFQGPLLAREAAFRTSTRGSEYLELRLADASLELKAFLWDVRAIEGDLDLVQADAFLWVKGTLSTYNGRLQLKLDKVRPISDGEVGDLGRFFPVSERPVSEMLEELDACIASIRDPWLRPLLESLLIADGARREAFSRAPAAKSMHHDRLGGLLEHTLSVARMADLAASHYPGVNRDLVLAGVLLHDLGKTEELVYGRAFGYSDAGNLLGHITLEVLWVSAAMDRIQGFPEPLRQQLLHILLSHHGRLEFGSPVLPKTPEAHLVHVLDDLDGKLESMFRSIREDGGDGHWTPFNRSLERVLFKNGWPRVP